MGEPSSKKRKTWDDSFVKWSLLFDDKNQEFTVYKGTPIEDILKNIGNITGFGVDGFVCKHKDNSLMAISSYLPNGTEIYIWYRVKRKQQQSEKVVGKRIKLKVYSGDGDV